jgi:hypothetical protein
MFVTGTNECLFGVFTEADYKIIVIDLDLDFINSNLNKLKMFYFLVILPELLEKKI